MKRLTRYDPWGLAPWRPSSRKNACESSREVRVDHVPRHIRMRVRKCNDIYLLENTHIHTYLYINWVICLSSKVRPVDNTQWPTRGPTNTNEEQFRDASLTYCDHTLPSPSSSNPDIYQLMLLYWYGICDSISDSSGKVPPSEIFTSGAQKIVWRKSIKGDKGRLLFYTRELLYYPIQVLDIKMIIKFFFWLLKLCSCQ